MMGFEPMTFPFNGNALAGLSYITSNLKSEVQRWHNFVF